MNLFVKVGRAERHCLGSGLDTATADALQQSKTAELLRSGVDLARVEFSRETPKAKKGKQ